MLFTSVYGLLFSRDEFKVSRERSRVVIELRSDLNSTCKLCNSKLKRWRRSEGEYLECKLMGFGKWSGSVLKACQVAGIAFSKSRESRIVRHCVISTSQKINLRREERGIHLTEIWRKTWNAIICWCENHSSGASLSRLILSDACNKCAHS